MRQGQVLSFMVGAVVLCLPVSVFADPITHTGSVSFISDLQPGATITLPTFDTQGGAHNLVGVLVEIFHSGSADLAVDNDDAFRAANVSGQIVREWTLSGPGINTNGSQTVNTGIVHLAVDNGDGVIFDTSGPDAANFGSVSYSDVAAGSFTPDPALYTTAGFGTVTFTVTPTYISNEMSFTGRAPNEYQTSLQNTNLKVTARVTYTAAPEPATLSLLAAGGLGTLLYRRRR
ncbi:MAG: PEP-CTERM sorting domain-containing protein [Planctomycetota bacterium]|nr:PEP-CTERM sorting domain-containing protein [Planctomycetota bacterium]